MHYEESEDERSVHYPDSAPSASANDSDVDLTHAPNRTRPIHRVDFGDWPLPARLP
jgi:hypothetical protein